MVCKPLKTRRVPMLVLSRSIGESIVISDNIHIKIVNLRNGQVRIGIDAPKNITVHREEIYEKIKSALTNPIKESDIDEVA